MAKKRRTAKRKKYKSTGEVHSCAVKLGRRGGKATAAKKRSRKRKRK